jgi:hypothetical protein
MICLNEKPRAGAFTKVSFERHARAAYPWSCEDVGGEEEAAHGDFAMTLQNAICKASPSGRRVGLPCCPQCADTLLAPLLAEHVSASLVHNHWVCESCGHAFRKSHEFEAFEDATA